MDVLGGLESGDKYRLEVPGLGYDVLLPYVRIPGPERTLRIASLNLIGQVKLNRDLGRLLARTIRKEVPDLEGVVMLTVVEKALQLAQVAAQELEMEAMAVAYNRIKPHMEADRRPVLQVGADSVTSGGKYLAVYERDMNLILGATRGFIIMDDVVSTGGTLQALMDLVDEVWRSRDQEAPPVLGVFCAATEGGSATVLPAPVHGLARLPAPQEVV
jgi:adenine phosphoribosyltransferase